MYFKQADLCHKSTSTIHQKVLNTLWWIERPLWQKHAEIAGQCILPGSHWGVTNLNVLLPSCQIYFLKESSFMYFEEVISLQHCSWVSNASVCQYLVVKQTYKLTRPVMSLKNQGVLSISHSSAPNIYRRMLMMWLIFAKYCMDLS